MPEKKNTRSRSKAKTTSAKDNQSSASSDLVMSAPEDQLISGAAASDLNTSQHKQIETETPTSDASDVESTADDDDDDPLVNILQRIDILEEACRRKDDHIKLIYGKLAMLQKDVKAQSDHQNDLTVRSMNQNIVISGKNASLNESRSENCKQIVENILRDDVEVQHGKVVVIRAHRLGYADPPDPNKPRPPRPIVARLGAREMVGEVMKRCGKLSGTDIYINPQYPQSIDERRQFIQKYRKAAKKKGADAKVSIDKLYVNNELRRDLLRPVIPAQMPPVLDDLPPINVARQKANEQCRVQMVVAGSKSLDDVSKCLDAALLKARAAPDAIVYAFRHSLGTDIRSNYDSGKAPGTGIRLLKMMENSDLRDKVAILYIWYRSGNTGARGSNFFDLVQESLDELVT